MRLITLALVVFAVFVGVSTFKNLFFPSAYQDLIHKYSREYKVDEYLVMAVIKAESNFIPDAHSGKASGLMQLTDETAEWVCKELDINPKKIDLFKPSDNIKLGCYYLKYLIDNYDGNIDVALAAYNGGMGNVNRWLSDKNYSKNKKDLHYIPFKETREYVIKVNRHWKTYKEIYEREE